jgi:hypothetical protein
MTENAKRRTTPSIPPGMMAPQSALISGQQDGDVQLLDADR